MNQHRPTGYLDQKSFRWKVSDWTQTECFIWTTKLSANNRGCVSDRQNMLFYALQFRSHSLANRHSCLIPAKNQEHRYRQCWTHYRRYDKSRWYLFIHSVVNVNRSILGYNKYLLLLQLWFLSVNVKLRLHDTTGCQIGCQTGLTTGLTTVLNEQQLFIQPVVKPGSTTGLTNTVWQPVGCLYTRYSRLSNRLPNGFDNRFDNRLYRVNGAL